MSRSKSHDLGVQREVGALDRLVLGNAGLRPVGGPCPRRWSASAFELPLRRAGSPTLRSVASELVMSSGDARQGGCRPARAAMSRSRLAGRWNRWRCAG